MAIPDENLLNSVEIETATPVKKSVIWLHGLGADGNDFVPVVPELRLPASLPIRFIFPHAPVMPVTINNGYEMPAWFDILSMEFERKIDERGIHTSVKAIEKLIDQEVSRGIDTSNIILAGFSQGAAVALTAGLTYPKTLGGIIGLSGYLPLPESVLERASPANKNIPIFLAHGTQDPIVPYLLGKSSFEFLKGAGYPVVWHSYPMPHSVCPEEITHISHWLQGKK